MIGEVVREIVEIFYTTSLAVETSSRVIRESRVACILQTETGGSRREEVEKGAYRGYSQDQDQDRRRDRLRRRQRGRRQQLRHRHQHHHRRHQEEILKR